MYIPIHERLKKGGMEEEIEADLRAKDQFRAKLYHAHKRLSHRNHTGDKDLGKAMTQDISNGNTFDI